MSYHGVVPVTKSDAKMAKKHLKATYKLNKQKIKDHQKAAKQTSDPKSVAYNRSHSAEHQKDNQGVQASLQTLYNKVKGDSMKVNIKKSGSTNGKSNKLGGGGRFQQMTNAGVSPGLAAFIGRKKYGASKMAKMAAKAK